jgi:phosphoribosylanthranilate isomerase
MIQFHGNESPEFCKKFKGYKIIKAFRVKDKIELKNLLNYKTFSYLFDTFVKSKMGGTGKKFNWTLGRHLKGLRKLIFLSGGLNARNVTEAIKQVRPDWLDVSSSVEIRPGKKDYKKVKEFIEIVKKTAL